MEDQEVKSLSKNDWKPIYELATVRLFSISFPTPSNPSYFFEVNRDLSEDGVLINVNSGEYHPAELVRVTDENKEVASNRSLKQRGLTEPYSAFGADEIRRTIRKKIEKKYSERYPEKGEVLLAIRGEREGI